MGVESFIAVQDRPWAQEGAGRRDLSLRIVLSSLCLVSKGVVQLIAFVAATKASRRSVMPFMVTRLASDNMSDVRVDVVT